MKDEVKRTRKEMRNLKTDHRSDIREIRRQLTSNMTVSRHIAEKFKIMVNGKFDKLIDISHNIRLMNHARKRRKMVEQLNDLKKLTHGLVTDIGNTYSF